MTKIKVCLKQTSDLYAFNAALESQGFVRNKDFTFEYIPKKFSIVEGIIQKHVIFSFFREEDALWFSLKYC